MILLHNRSPNFIVCVFSLSHSFTFMAKNHLWKGVWFTLIKITSKMKLRFLNFTHTREHTKVKGSLKFVGECIQMLMSILIWSAILKIVFTASLTRSSFISTKAKQISNQSRTSFNRWNLIICGIQLTKKQVKQSSCVWCGRLLNRK